MPRFSGEMLIETRRSPGWRKSKIDRDLFCTRWTVEAYGYALPFRVPNNNCRWEPMRQGQQNRRGRGRGGNNPPSNNNNNNHRKPQNPLSRTYESNGPDVKIRGTASQIAEKYSTLARDASSSGDVIMSENYLQHAEHYNRIIMAAQAQVPQVVSVNGSDSGYAVNGAHRPDREMNGAMRDQPQPSVEDHPPAEHRVPARAEAPEPYTDDKPSAEKKTSAEPRAARGVAKEAAKNQPETDANVERRRRRRYPGGTDAAGPRAAKAEDLFAAPENVADPAPVSSDATPSGKVTVS